MLNYIIRNTELRFIGDYVNIVCALCNAFRPDLASSKESDERVANAMLARKDSQNELHNAVSAFVLILSELETVLAIYPVESVTVDTIRLWLPMFIVIGNAWLRIITDKAVTW